MLKSPVIEKWWPTTQALELVEGPADVVAQAVLAAVGGFVGEDVVECQTAEFGDVHGALSRAAAQGFCKVPTTYLILSTHSEWTVIWNDCFLCDGHDSLCRALTADHGLTTVHWSAHDETTTFQPGAMFHMRRLDRATLVERRVQVAANDGAWAFFSEGTPLAQEDVEGYRARLARDRLNEKRIAELLAVLGAEPWREEFYDLEHGARLVRRTHVPASVERRAVEDVLRSS